MNRGAKAALLISSVAIGGCTGAAPEVKVRAIDNASAQISRSGDALAVARGQLMLGNAGTIRPTRRCCQESAIAIRRWAGSISLRRTMSPRSRLRRTIASCFSGSPRSTNAKAIGRGR